jgi:hypothetical protein
MNPASLSKTAYMPLVLRTYHYPGIDGMRFLRIVAGEIITDAIATKNKATK